MSISSRQVKKQVNKIVEERMKEGYIPSVDYVSYKLGEFYSMYAPGFPFFKNRKQPYRKLFNITNYNANLEEIYEDLNNLYEELIDQFTVVLTDFDYFETERRKTYHQIKTLEGQLTDLMLVTNDTDGYIYSVHDSFDDRSKMDLEYSTCEINTDAGIATLRESRSGILKLDMSHYFEKINFPILTDDTYSGRVLSNTLFPSSKFGYAFSDIGSSWVQNIVTDIPGELKLSFIVELNPNSDSGEYITRIEVSAQSPKSMIIEPLYSIDNINFVTLPMGEGERQKVAAKGKVTVWNFDELRIRYIKFMITKTEEDEQTSRDGLPAYRYVIGFKHIEFFKMGYDRSSVLYSSAFQVVDPAGEALTIDKAAIVTKSDVQPGTSLTYYLSLGSNTVTDPTQYNWAPVSAINDPNPKEQQLIDFKHIAFFGNVPEIQWDSSSYGTALETYQGVSFYKVYQFPYEPIKDSVSLFRGKNDWIVTPSYSINRKSVYDEKHSFGSAMDVTLDFPNFTPVEGDGLVRGSVRVKSDPGQNPAYWATTPGDFIVEHSSKKITRNIGGIISGDPSAPSNTIYVDYQYDEEVPKPTIYSAHIYIIVNDGVDVRIKPFTQAQIDEGHFSTISTPDGDIDVSSEDKIHLAPGWHKITTTGEPFSVNDIFYSANKNKYISDIAYQQYAYAEKLQETSWFDLKYNTFMSDHSKFCIVDYDGDGNKEIIVNYRPQDAKWTTASEDLLCSRGPETYVLSYKFITDATDRIYFKALFTRDADTAATSTPTLFEYTVKLGY